MAVLSGLEDAAPTADELKAFSAAFGTTAAAPLFHIAGVTPEAPTVAAAVGLGANDADEVEARDVSADDLRRAWAALDSGDDEAVQLIALGNPHLSLSEWEQLATLCAAERAAGRRVHDGVRVVVTSGREVMEQARAAGHAAEAEAFGATVLSDTCWCMLQEPLVPPTATTLMTNSAKYAHYAPALVGERCGTGASRIASARRRAAARRAGRRGGCRAAECTVIRLVYVQRLRVTLTMYASHTDHNSASTATRTGFRHLITRAPARYAFGGKNVQPTEV